MKLSNVLQFPSRSERLPRPAPVADVRPMERDTRPMPAPAEDDTAAQVQVLSTLAFYAGQGHDHGQRARAALEQIHARVSASMGEQA